MESGGEQSNRLFIILAIALIGLICIGLLGLGGVLFITGAFQSPEDIAVAPTPTIVPPTFTPTSTATFTPTPTPEPTSTPTSVVHTPTSIPVEGDGAAQEEPTPVPTVDPGPLASASATSEAEVTATNTPVPPTATPELVPDSGGVLPTTGNGFLLWIGGALLVVLLAFGGINRFFSSETSS